MRDRTTFVIAHRLSTITGADWTVVLQDGCVLEQGTHTELLAREDGLYRRMIALQFRWDEPPDTETGGDGDTETGGQETRKHEDLLVSPCRRCALSPGRQYSSHCRNIACPGRLNSSRSAAFPSACMVRSC